MISSFCCSFRSCGTPNESEGEVIGAILSDFETEEDVCHSSPIAVNDPVEYLQQQLIDKDSSIKGVSMHHR